MSPLVSVTRKDLRIDFYKGTGKGGQKRNKTENCCRITHLESGAVGKSEEGRSKEHNKKAAFVRMTQAPEFQGWMRLETARALGLDAEIEKSLRPQNLKIEVKNAAGLWVLAD